MPGRRRDGLAERGARDRDDGEVGLGDRRRRDRGRGDPREVDVREVARVPARRRDRRGLVGVAARERHLVAAVAKDDRERRAPGAAADHRDAHALDSGAGRSLPASDPYSLLTKSIETGTPSSSNRLRSSFSTQ